MVEPAVLVDALRDELVRKLGVLDVRLITSDGGETVCSSGEECGASRVGERLVLRKVDIIEDCAVRSLPKKMRREMNVPRRECLTW